MKSSMAMRPRSRGFTLIEILIVVAILGILAAIVIPSFGSIGDDAVEAAVRADLRTVRTQIQVYRARHDAVNPASISTLVAERYLPREPVHQGAGSFEYDSSTGRFWSTRDPSW